MVILVACSYKAALPPCQNVERADALGSRCNLFLAMGAALVTSGRSRSALIGTRVSLVAAVSSHLTAPLLANAAACYFSSGALPREAPLKSATQEPLCVCSNDGQ